jgi:hypothetical protein
MLSYKKEVFEKSLMSNWDSHKELTEVMEYFCESDQIDPDEAANLIGGIISLMSIRLQNTMRNYDILETALTKALIDKGL